MTEASFSLFVPTAAHPSKAAQSMGCDSRCIDYNKGNCRIILFFPSARKTSPLEGVGSADLILGTSSDVPFPPFSLSYIREFSESHTSLRAKWS